MINKKRNLRLNQINYLKKKREFSNFNHQLFLNKNFFMREKNDIKKREISFYQFNKDSINYIKKWKKFGKKSLKKWINHHKSHV